VAEERVEPVSTQVCKYVTEQRSMQVPRVVEKKTPYTYTVRSPRTVVMRVPLDACGNPIPTAAAAPAIAPAPSAAARPAAAAAAAAPALTPAEAGAMKTFSDKPADQPVKPQEGWTSSAQPHVDPAQAEAVRAQKPVAPQQPTAARDEAANLRPIESIPAPPAKAEAAAPQAPAAAPKPAQEPTVAPLGPSVEPAPPAADTRDVPAAETSGGLLRIEAIRGDRTT
jgi:hypothetical protein